MAVTSQDYTGNGSNTTYEITSFDYLDDGDVRVTVAGVSQAINTNYTVDNKTVTFKSGSIPANNAAIRIYRNTNLDSAKHTFQTGASVKADSLNLNNKQLRYYLQELGTPTASTIGLALTTGNKNDIEVSAANDWVIRNSAVVEAMIDNNAITSGKIDGDQIDSQHYVNASIDHEHLANDCIDGDNIQDNAVNSEHYTDGSIDHVHLAGDCIDSDNISDNSIGNEHMKDDAIGIAELSASGTASATTFLRGDNSWGAAGKLLGFATANTTTSVTGSEDTWVDTGLTVNYTPQSTNSTILVTSYVTMYGKPKADSSGTHSGKFRLRLRVNASDVTEATVGEAMLGQFGKTSNSTYFHYIGQKEWQWVFHEEYSNTSTTQKTFHLECEEQDESIIEVCRNEGRSFINVMEVE